MRYIGFYATVSILFSLTHGCATGRRGVAVESCVIPPPLTDKEGRLYLDAAECTGADGVSTSKPFIFMERYVCHPEQDYFKVLESRK